MRLSNNNNKFEPAATACECDAASSSVYIFVGYLPAIALYYSLHYIV